MIDPTVTPGEEPPVDAVASEPGSPTPGPLILFGTEDDDLLCLDDTCVPAAPAR